MKCPLPSLAARGHDLLNYMFAVSPTLLRFRWLRRAITVNSSRYHMSGARDEFASMKVYRPPEEFLIGVALI